MNRMMNYINSNNSVYLYLMMFGFVASFSFGLIITMLCMSSLAPITTLAYKMAGVNFGLILASLIISVSCILYISIRDYYKRRKLSETVKVAAKCFTVLLISEIVGTLLLILKEMC